MHIVNHHLANFMISDSAAKTFLEDNKGYGLKDLAGLGIMKLTELTLAGTARYSIGTTWRIRHFCYAIISVHVSIPVDVSTRSGHYGKRRNHDWYYVSMHYEPTDPFTPLNENP